MPGLTATILLLTLAAGPARAPTADEQKAFSEGLRLLQAGDAAGAERAWKAGYAIGHDPAFLVRIGEAQEKEGDRLAALQSYLSYVRESPDAADRADIDERIRRLTPPPETGQLEEPVGEIGAAPAGPGVPPAAAPSAAPNIGAAPPGRRAQQSDAEADDLAASFADDAMSPLGVGGWVGTGVTAVLLGLAAYYGASAADKSGDANRLLLFTNMRGVPQEYEPVAAQFEEDVRVGRRNDRIAKGLVIAAGATAIVTTILFVLDSRREKTTAPARARSLSLRPAAPASSGGGAPALGGLGLSWSF